MFFNCIRAANNFDKISFCDSPFENSAEDDVNRERWPTKMGIKCSNMQHETLSNDLVPWHVSLGASDTNLAPGETFLSVAPRKRWEKERLFASRSRTKRKMNGRKMAGEWGLPRAWEGERRRTNEGRITANVIFIPGPLRGQRGHQQTGYEWKLGPRAARERENSSRSEAEWGPLTVMGPPLVNTA